MSPPSTTKRSKLVLVDGNAIMHRAYHAMPKLTNRRGEAIGAVYGFTSMLLKIIEDLKPTHLAVCFDRKEPTFRKKEFKEYQSHRPETDKDLTAQFGKAKDVTKSMKISVFEKAGFEADDLIGTLSKRSKGKINKVVIVTGDKDIMQLIDDRIFVYLPIRGLSQAKMMKRRDVYGKLGVYPEQIIDYKALMGDPSDNYPGVYGIGPKTAEQLLGKYKTYKNVYKHLDEIPDTTAMKLKGGKEGGDISYKLARIVTDVDFKYDIEGMDDWQINNVEVQSAFDDIGFRSLKKRVQKQGEKALNKSPNRREIEKLVVKLAKILKGKQYAFRGTVSLVLQEYDMGVDDVDVLCDKKTALKCNELLRDYLLEKVDWKKTEQYKSYYGKFVVNDILVEIYGDWQIKSGRKGWSKVFNASNDEIGKIKLKGRKIKVTKPEVELSVFAIEGRWNAHKKLKRQMETKHQQELF